MAAETSVIGLFKEEAQVLHALEDIREGGWRLERVHSPIPNHRIMDALRLKKSRVGYYTLAGGIIGFFAGFLLAIYCAGEWRLIVSGKPVVALVPFFIVGFEFTILFSVFGNVVGLINEGGLPDYRGLAGYHPKCSGEHYGVVARCVESQKDALMDCFRKLGGEAEVLAVEAQRR